MRQTSSPYHVGAGHNHNFGVETFFCQRCYDTLFWPIGPCIMLSPIQTHPRVGADRAGMPDLSVRWIISIGGGGDSRDPTTNETGRGALAIAEPTPNGY
jgi:hypothetical protein